MKHANLDQRTTGSHRAITGSWRVQSREGPAAQRLATDVNRRRPSSLPKRLLLGRLVRGGALLGIAGLAAAGVVRLASVVEKSDALPVRTVAVRAATNATDAANAANAASPANGASAASAALSKDRADEILAYAGVREGEPLFAVDV